MLLLHVENTDLNKFCDWLVYGLLELYPFPWLAQTICVFYTTSVPIFSHTLPKFSPGYETTKNIFYFFHIKLLFPSWQRERRYTKCICILSFLSWNCKFSQHGDSQQYFSHHFHALYGAHKVDQAKRLYYPNYFRITLWLVVYDLTLWTCVADPESGIVKVHAPGIGYLIFDTCSIYLIRIRAKALQLFINIYIKLFMYWK